MADSADAFWKWFGKATVSAVDLVPLLRSVFFPASDTCALFEFRLWWLETVVSFVRSEIDLPLDARLYVGLKVFR